MLSNSISPGVLFQDLVAYEDVSFATVGLPSLHGYRSEWMNNGDAIRALTDYIDPASLGALFSAASQIQTPSTTILSVDFSPTGSVHSVFLVDSDLPSSASIGNLLSTAHELRISQNTAATATSGDRFSMSYPGGPEPISYDDALDLLSRSRFLIVISRYDWIGGDHKGFPVEGSAGSLSTWVGSRSRPRPVEIRLM
jgi:hypothetical protein